MKGRGRIDVSEKQTARCCKNATPAYASTPLPHPFPETHHDRPQHLHEGADPLPVLNECLPQRLLLRLLQQDVFIADILHGAVQLGLDVSPAWRTQGRQRGHGGNSDKTRERRDGLETSVHDPHRTQSPSTPKVPYRAGIQVIGIVFLNPGPVWRVLARRITKKINKSIKAKHRFSPLFVVLKKNVNF